MDYDPALFQENERTTPAQAERRTICIGDLTLELGGVLPQVTLAYETWGELSPKSDNAVLIFHALTGDPHAIGWWDRIVGPGKAIDTDTYYVICANLIGGCQGSTGPSSMAPDGRAYGSRFPQVTLGDMVSSQKTLLDLLQVPRLRLACGGSVGGMLAIEWAMRFPNEVDAVWTSASCASQTAMQIGFNEAGRQAVMRDPRWHGGDYSPTDPPKDGLAIARMIGHLGYLSSAAFDEKFGRALRMQPAPGQPHQFEVESYLGYQGDKFTDRFDANSYLVLTRALNLYERTSLIPNDSSAPRSTKFLFTSFSSDWLYPPAQSHLLHEMAQGAGYQSMHLCIDLPYGHDAFLLDGTHQAAAVRKLLS